MLWDHTDVNLMPTPRIPKRNIYRYTKITKTVPIAMTIDDYLDCCRHAVKEGIGDRPEIMPMALSVGGPHRRQKRTWNEST